MVKIALLFPGQGSQFVGMGKDFYDNFSSVRKMYDEASEALGVDIKSISFDGPESDLILTENTQPAILIHSIIALNLLREHDTNCMLSAGHSLGEYSALVAAGAVGFLDAVKLVQLRGRFMQEAVPVGVGSMAAIIGMPVNEIQKLCDEASSDDGQVQLANLNSPEQTVIAGHKEPVEKVASKAKELGAKKAILLPVSAPFHSSLMKPAEVKLQKELEKTNFQDLSFPVITNVDAIPITNGVDAKTALRQQVCSSVRWVETMKYIVGQGIHTVIELGPGKVLSGLMRRYDKSIKCLQVNDMSSLERTVEALKQN